MMLCDCRNTSTLCDWCAAHADCVAPDTVTVSRGHFTGEPVARCAACGWSCVGWWCACDLEHECLGGSCDWCDEPHDPSNREDHCADCGTCWEHCEQGHGVMLDGRGSWGPRQGVAS